MLVALRRWRRLVLAWRPRRGCGKKRPPVARDPGDAGGARPPTARPPARRRSRVDDRPRRARRAGAKGASGEDIAVVRRHAARAGPSPTSTSNYDQATLTDEARGHPREARALAPGPPRRRKVTVEGHCDERGTVEYNLALGDQRARAARDYLVSLGVAGRRGSATVSYGKERPARPRARRGGLGQEPARALRGVAS